MTKIINTLVDDIYTMLQDGIGDDVDMHQLDDQINQCCSDIKDALYRTLVEGQREQSQNLRMSMVGKPDRQIWYSLNAPAEAGEVIDGKTKLRFLQGHVWEAILLLFAKASGHTVTNEQRRVEINGVSGSMDCHIDGTVCDLKTTSNWGMKKFESAEALKSDDPFGYVHQISCYAHEQGSKEAVLWAVDKSSGDMKLCFLHESDMIDAPKRIDHLKKITTQSEPPERCYEPVEDGSSGNMKLAMGCVFCSYKEICWADANDGQGLRTFQYANKKVYLTHVEKEPKVQEIIND